jgi:hypothetical protein
MSSSNTIQDELNSLNSKLPYGLKSQVFAVPEGYFEGLASAVLSRIRGEQLPAKDEIALLSPLLAAIPREMPLTVPDDYFQSTIDTVPALLAEEEASPVLFLADKKMPNEIPEGYFEHLPGKILSKLAPGPKARIVPMRRLTRWAVAAMVAGIMVVSGIFYFKGNPNIPVDNPNWVATKLKNVSDRDIDEFVKTTDANAVTVHKSTSKTADVTGLLKDVSDKELDAFLNQVPADEEELLN